MTRLMHIHIVGVCGTAMGSLAGLLCSLGHEVSGSDIAFDPPMGPALERWGVRCFDGFRPEHLAPRPDLAIVGNVCRPDNPEARAAIDSGIEYTHVAGALQRFALEGTRPLVVAGTHGKTTTSSMAAWLLEATGREPGFLIGGLPGNFEQSFRATSRRRLPIQGRTAGAAAPPFVLEGDEYDTAFFEKTAKFLHYRAEVAIIGSIEHDHIDIYPSFDSYREAFERFVAMVPPSGLVVANAADPVVVDVVRRKARADVAFCALGEDRVEGVTPHWLAELATSDAQATSFDLYAGGVSCGRFAVPLPGRHNVRNAIASIAACAGGYGVPIDALGRALLEFKGVKRRQELIGSPRGIAVYDDFAHHPTAVEETLRALRLRHPKAQLFAVFEPRSATACRALHQDRYTRAFDAADHVLLAPLGRKNIADGEALDLGRVVYELGERGKRARAAESIDAIISELRESARPGDAIALLSNGAFGGIYPRLLAALEQP